MDGVWVFPLVHILHMVVSKLDNDGMDGRENKTLYRREGRMCVHGEPLCIWYPSIKLAEET